MKKWYAVYTKPSCEKKVVNGLAKKGFEGYAPFVPSKKQWQDSKNGLDEPLFPSFVFVRALEGELKSLLQIPGAINLIYWLDKPAVIQDIEIEMMRRFLNGHKDVQIQKMAVNVDAIAQIINESSTAEKELMTINDTNSKLMLPSLGYFLLSETKTMQLEPENKSYNYPAEFTGKLTLN